MDYIVNCLCNVCENDNPDGFCKVMLLPTIKIDGFGRNICECGGFVEKDEKRWFMVFWRKYDFRFYKKA